MPKRKVKRPVGRPKKKQKEKRPPGRPRVNFEFEEAVQKIRAENLRSVREYAKWYALNTPAKLPKRPDRAYKNEWKGWGYFLGTYNTMPIERQNFRSYKDSKAFARKLGYHTVEQWHEFCRSGEKPKDIPARPDVYYQKSGEWFTWSEFLGTRIHHKLEYAKKEKKFFYIGRYDDVEFPNIYVFGIDTSLFNLVNDSEFNIIKIYEYHDDFDWIDLVERNGSQFFGNGRPNEYIIKNPGNLLYDISLDLNEVRNIN